MTQKSMSFNYYWKKCLQNSFWDMTKSQAVNRMKSVDLSEKSGKLWKNKKWEIIVLEDNIAEAVSRWKQCNQKAKMEIEKGLDSIIKTTKSYKNSAEIDTENYLRQKKIKKCIQEADTEICLTKTIKIKKI